MKTKKKMSDKFVQNVLNDVTRGSLAFFDNRFQLSDAVMRYTYIKMLREQKGVKKNFEIISQYFLISLRHIFR